MRSSETRLSLMKGCKELVCKYFPIEVALSAQVDKIFYEVLKKTGDIKPQTRQQQANFALAVRSYRGLHRSFDDIEDGYFEIALTTLRSVYENYVQMDYFVTHEEDARKWVEEDAAMDQGKMRKALGLKSDFYTMLSRNYAHPLRVVSIKPIMLDIAENGKLSLNIYPVFSPSDCYLCLFIWIFLANKIIQQVQRVFKAAQIADKQWMRKVVDVQKLVDQYIDAEKQAQTVSQTSRKT